MLLIIDQHKVLHFGRKGQLTDTLKGEQVETLRLQFENTSGTVAALANGTTFLVGVKAAKDATTFLASVSSFSLSGTTYSGELDLRNDAVRALENGSQLYIEVIWTLATKPQRSDDARITYQAPVVDGTESAPVDGGTAASIAWLETYFPQTDLIRLAEGPANSGKLLVYQGDTLLGHLTLIEP